MNAGILRSCIQLLFLLAVGCATPRVPPPPDAVRLAGAAPEAAVARHNLSGNLAELVDSPQFGAAADHPRGIPARNVLVLSGGGNYGAYSAGVLAGWTAAGNRPTFDVVTGVSAGALLAPLAFLGPKYDQFMTDSYTTARTEDIYRRRPCLAVLWSDSLADSEPLKRRIDAQVTDGFLAEIAKAHEEGRRLYVGTTNLDSGRLVIWDLGAIAAGSNPEKRELFRRILLASCSIPGLLPPVPIDIEVDGRKYTELHADGGVSASMFLHPCMVLEPPGPTGTNVFVLVAGKLAPEANAVQRRILSVSSSALYGLTSAQTQSDLLKVFLLTRLTGGNFAVASVPQELQVNRDSTRFEPEEMRRLFDAGVEHAASATAWRPTPPAVRPEEWTWPRTGTQFAVPKEKTPRSGAEPR